MTVAVFTQPTAAFVSRGKVFGFIPPRRVGRVTPPVPVASPPKPAPTPATAASPSIKVASPRDQVRRLYDLGYQPEQIAKIQARPLALVKELLGEINAPGVSPRKIAVAARAAGITTVALLAPGRSSNAVHARWAVMVALHEAGWSTPRIGKALGDRDHTTVMHGLESARRLEADYPPFAAMLAKVRAA